ncbi:type II toxin-antitoxin system RelE/ParE family toxin [Candidatus Roizmanbacteria bacterium]|nr:type II toxin-antitoxin system RelE/ParE family toxin [Candidatus Roizmanbacteria bacterium]
MYKILLSKKADKELEKFAAKESLTILKKIHKLSFPLPDFLNIKKLAGLKYGYRLRIGKVRIIFEIDHDSKIIWIRKIGYRKDIYRFS